MNTVTTPALSVLRLAALAGVVGALSACGSREPEAAAPEPQPAAPQTAATNETPPPDQTIRAAGYEIAVWDGSDAGSGRLEMSKGGRPVYAVTGERFVLGGPGESARRVGLGEDITADGTPNLIVELWTGGTVCCVDYLVYELGDTEPELLGRLSAQTGGRFEDFNGDGAYEVRLHDGAFLGWNAGVEDAPAPPVVLRWDGLWYTPAPDLMHAPAPTDEQLTTWLRVVENGEEWDRAGSFAPPAQLWGVALDLMYTGHRDLGLAFIDSAWRDDIPGRSAFIAAFLDKLDDSSYWPAIARTQRVVATDRTD